jgi:membrane associated rhomboid family serine protease
MYLMGDLVAPAAELPGLLALNAPSVLDGSIWQLVTGPLFHKPGDIFGLAMNMLWLVFLGPQLESMLGTRKFLQTYAWCMAGAVALSMVVGLLGHFLGLGTFWNQLWGTHHAGATGAILGLLACWVGRMDGQVAHFALLGPMPVRTFGMIVFGITLLLMFVTPDSSASMHLGGMAMGYAIGTGRWPRDRKKSDLVARKKRIEKELRRFEVIEGGRAGEPKTGERPRGWTGWGGDGEGGPTVH